MAYQSEAELENLLIKQLVEEGYEEIEVKDYQLIARARAIGREYREIE